MGFIQHIYPNNRVELIVSFQGDLANKQYTPTNNVNEAIEYFNLELKDNNLYKKSRENTLYNSLGVNDAEELLEVRAALDEVINEFTDEQALNYPILFENWQPNKPMVAGTRCRYENILYKVLQNHTSQIGWEPLIAPSLFARVLTSETDEVLPWIQPDSTNGYEKGDKVIHRNKKWVSLTNDNVWEPGTTGAPWQAYEDIENNDENNDIPEWEQPSAGNPYNIGDRVVFEGNIYESIIDNNVWSPAAYPAGWQLISE